MSGKKAGGKTTVRKTASERAYQFAKSAILSLEYQPGSRLPEELIASELGVSRTPVRDALRRLESEGLVDFAPNTGARVASWGMSELSEMAQMRSLLEGYAATLAATKINDEQLARLEQATVEMETAAQHPQTPDLAAISEANLRFHSLIAEAANNTHLTAAIKPLWHFPLVFRKFALFKPERLELSVRHHREIIAALAARDPDWASAIMRAHIHSAQSFDHQLAVMGTQETGES
ncbi:GntR family transcriptional regulator [Microbulbifer sp. S227A]|uniref:GntR family transcriptional regulator n=1 Tax=Microbulbifer sp. S227A TaxID=3415131 RepID=UPI003C7BBE7F